MRTSPLAPRGFTATVQIPDCPHCGRDDRWHWDAQVSRRYYITTDPADGGLLLRPDEVQPEDELAHMGSISCDHCAYEVDPTTETALFGLLTLVLTERLQRTFRPFFGEELHDYRDL